jgi:predicted 3-demethylubiquinone-9 3-methyltransferase (glyoxalase superfamily)
MAAFTTSFLFNTEALEAAEYYVALFPNSSIDSVSYYPEGAPLPSTTALSVEFTLNGVSYTAINAGQSFPFSEALSIRANCASQEEVDVYWDRLLDGGIEGQCGWLKDRFGVSWQVVPMQMGEYLGHPDPAKRQRAMAAMMQMKKLDLRVFAEAIAD